MTEEKAVPLNPETTPDSAAARNSSSSLRRALGLLMYVAGNGADLAGVSLTPVSGGLEMSKSKALRLAAPLVEAGLLVRTPTRGHFRLGSGAAARPGLLDGLDLRSVAEPFLFRLLGESGNTCHLVVRDGMDVAYIGKVENFAAMSMASRIGKRMALQRTAVGTSILAFSGATLAKQVLETGLSAITPWSITDPEMFQPVLDNAEARLFHRRPRERIRGAVRRRTDLRPRRRRGRCAESLGADVLAQRRPGTDARRTHLHTGLEISAQLGSLRARRMLVAARPHQTGGLR